MQHDVTLLKQWVDKYESNIHTVDECPDLARLRFDNDFDREADFLRLRFFDAAAPAPSSVGDEGTTGYARTARRAITTGATMTYLREAHRGGSLLPGSALFWIPILRRLPNSGATSGTAPFAPTGFCFHT